MVPIVKMQPEAGIELAIAAALQMEAMRRYNHYFADQLGM
ncbi:hypothetical protein RintRC_2822 [Richelia intracellularis]|nr:hypothetical protein RintRC_2822 [Richelia intracellularis]